MPQGKGTYGSKVGRPPKKKKIDPKKGSDKKKTAIKKKEQTGYGPQNRPGTFPKKRVVRGSDKKKSGAPTGNQGIKRKRKKKPVNTPSAPAGYSRRTRMDMAAKEALSGGVAKKKKVKKKDNGGVKKGKVKKGKVYTKPQGPRHLALKKRADARDKKPKKKKVMSVAQLRKAGKINF